MPASSLNLSFVVLDEQMARSQGEASSNRSAAHRLGGQEAIGSHRILSKAGWRDYEFAFHTMPRLSEDARPRC